MNLTWQQLAERELPECEPNVAGYLLWNETAFGVCSEPEIIVEQLQQARIKYLGIRDLTLAWCAAGVEPKDLTITREAWEG